MMSLHDDTPDSGSITTTSPLFPLLCGLEFVQRPIRLARASQQDFEQLVSLATTHHWQFDRQRVRTFLQNPAHALVITDRRRLIQFVNEGFRRMTGYDRHEASGQSPAFLQGAETSAETRQAIRECLAADKPFVGDVANYRKNGDLYWCRVSIEPIRNKKEQVVHYVAFEREVSRKEAQTEGY